MITHVYSVTAMPGKQADLVAAMKAISAVAKKVLDLEGHVVKGIGGNPLAFAWLWTAESITSVEVNLAKLFGEPEYIAALKPLEGLYVPGSAHQQFWGHL
jgi:hypothetical protein